MVKDNVIAVRKLGQQYAYTSIQMHETIAGRAGFSSTDHKYLGFFLQQGELTAGRLAALTGLTTGAVTGLVDRFEQMKLVKRQPDKKDRRKVVIVPNSAKIRKLLEPYYKEFQAGTEEIIASFSDKEIKVIESFLMKSLDLMKTTKEKFSK